MGVITDFKEGFHINQLKDPDILEVEFDEDYDSGII